jgi:ribonuclease J
MKVRILRGANEIGGSCVEVEAIGSRIVLDVGKPLWADWGETVPLPPVPGLADGADPTLAGVVISHPHLDHYGLIDQVDASVPLYIGREAASLLKEAEFFSAAGVELHPTEFLSDRVPLKIGGFTVTPYLMDHSAFDSYSLLVEAENRRVFYTGDIRAHGRKSRLFDELLNDPPHPIDVLLCEGTHIRHVNESTEQPRSEHDVEVSLVQRMQDTTGAVSIISSAQNIDRLVTVYRACRQSGRTLVTDLYTASLAHAIGRGSIPQPGYSDYKVYVPNRQRVLVKQSGQFERMNLIKDCRVFPEWLVENAGNLVLLLPSSAIPEMLRADVMEAGVVIWSLWPGYLKDSSGKRLLKSIQTAGLPFVMDHASGHASVADLQRLAAALQPARLVPIHTEGAERYGEYFEHVESHDDGEWWTV